MPTYFVRYRSAMGGVTALQIWQDYKELPSTSLEHGKGIVSEVEISVSIIADAWEAVKRGEYPNRMAYLDVLFPLPLDLPVEPKVKLDDSAIRTDGRSIQQDNTNEDSGGAGYSRGESPSSTYVERQVRPIVEAEISDSYVVSTPN